MRRENVTQLDPPQLEAAIKDMRNAHSSSDPDLQRRLGLMARFFSKAVALDPSEEKFLFLWTTLEVFPMKDTTNIGPISDYLGQIVIDLCISNRHHERKKEGSLEAVTKETRSCCRFRASVVSWQSVSINSSRLSGRPFASSCLRWRHTHSSGFSSGV